MSENFERLTGEAPKGKKGKFISGGDGKRTENFKAAILTDEEVEELEAAANDGDR